MMGIIHSHVHFNCQSPSKVVLHFFLSLIQRRIFFPVAKEEKSSFHACMVLLLDYVASTQVLKMNALKT